MKLDARQLVQRILPRREEELEPPPPYSADDPHLGAPAGTGASGIGLPLTRTISPRRPLPTPPASNIDETLSRASSTAKPRRSSSQRNGAAQPPPVPPPAHAHTHSRTSSSAQASTAPPPSIVATSCPTCPPPNASVSGATSAPTSADSAMSLSFLSSTGYTVSPPLLSPLPQAPTTTYGPQPPLVPLQQQQQPRRRSPSPKPARKFSIPPYGAAPRVSPGTPGLGKLPLGLLHKILMYVLDPRATPDAWAWDIEMERVRRLVWLAQDFRAVDRRFFLLATSILRERMLPTYRSLLQSPSSNPLPPPGSADMTSTSVFAQRSREAAVLDRFVATRLGEDLRRAESALCEDSGEDEVLFSRLQPAARVEDLLLRLPDTLIAPAVPGEHLGALRQRLPLPHAHVAVTLSPLWAQLWLSYTPITPVPRSGTRAGRSLVVEVRKSPTPEDMVRTFGQALELLRQGKICWGWSYRSST